MSFTAETFGESLSHFVRSIDIVDTSTKDDVLNLIAGYLEDEFGIKFFTMYMESSIDQKVGLIPTDWYRGGDRASFTIQDHKGSYRGQVSLAYDRGISLWIVSSDGGALSLAALYKNLLPNAESAEIPKYIKRTEHEIMTSIIRPVHEDNRIYGVINFESEQYIEYSPAIAEEFKKISNSISTLFLLSKIYQTQRRNTKHEINYLSELKNNREGLLHLEKPRVFIASSSRAEDDVMSLILEVLDEYDRRKVKIVYWKTISESGLITQQILKEIRSCQYGICYLSEPVSKPIADKVTADKVTADKVTADKAIAYQDNSNVLIEAGMLSALPHEANFDNWIPIREEASGPLPFDFVSNRTLLVPRLKTNALNAEKFKVDLRSRLENCSVFSDLK